MKGKTILDEVTFRPVKGAHSISVTRRKTDRGGQGGGPSFDYGSEEVSHPTIKHAQDHLAKVFHTESGTEKPGGKYDEKDRGGPEVAAAE
jgi:hypothetical protein